MKITLRGKGNVFEQIVDEYIKLISLNVLLPDEKLPSCRNLAKDLGINPNTVEKAYSILVDKGYITVIPKKGYYVSSNNKNDLNEDVFNQIKLIKDSGIDYDSLIKIVNDVYRGDDNDRN